MATYKIKWSELLNLTELEFLPMRPKTLLISDELSQVISWLTGATGHDRRLLRCDDNGALLINNAWSNLSEVETDELYPLDGVPDSYIATKVNKGVLVAISTQIVKVSFVRKFGGAAEHIYVSPSWLYWYPHTVYSVTATVVPASGGTASYVGITAFN